MESSAFLEKYETGRRGMFRGGDISADMFQEKYETTDIYEDPDALYNDQRAGLRDVGPQTTGLFAHELPQRRTDSTRIRMMTTGSRYQTDPYANPEFDTQFHDRDPRGTTNEIPWHDYRSQNEIRYRHLDYKDDDGGQQMTETTPVNVARRIRDTFNWIKERLKNFEESKDNMTGNGVGIYANKSSVYKSSGPDTLLIDEDEDDTRTEKTVFLKDNVARISNILHLGGAFRENTTTDHMVKVADYNKIYSAMSVLPAASRVDLVESDGVARPENIRYVPKGLVKLMSDKIDGTSAAASRLVAQEMMTGSDSKKHESLARGQNSKVTTGDIMALLGVTETEVRRMQQTYNNNRKIAGPALMNIIEMVDAVEGLSAQAKLELRDSIMTGMFRSGNPIGNNLRKNRDEVGVNPVLVDSMKLATRKKTMDGDHRQAESEVEVKVSAQLSTQVRRTGEHSDKDIRREVESTAVKKVEGVPVKQYRTFVATNPSLQKKKVTIQELMDGVNSRNNKAAAVTGADFYKNMTSTALDVEFGENRGLRRGGGKVRTSTHTKDVQSTSASYDKMSDMTSKMRKTNL